MILPQFCAKMNEGTDRLYKGLPVPFILMKDGELWNTSN